MSLKRLASHAGQPDGPPRTRRLGLHERWLAVDALQCLAHAELAVVDIDVLPPKTKQFTLAQPGRHRHCVQRLEAVCPNPSEQLLDLDRSQWPYLLKADLRRIDQRRYVPANQP